MLSLILALSPTFIGRPILGSVEQICSKLANEVEMGINISEPLRHERLVIWSKESNPRATLKVIADSLSATLDTSGNTFLLFRSSTDAQALQHLCQKRKQRWIENTIDLVDRYRKSLIGDKTISQSIEPLIESQVTRLQTKGISDLMNENGNYAAQLLPDQQLLIDVVQKIGIDKFAQIPSGETHVFESSGSLYDPMPDCSDAIAKFFRSATLLHSHTFSKSALDGLQRLGPLFPVKNYLHPIAPITSLRLRAWSSENEILFFLDGYDASGQLVTTSNLRAASTLKREVSESLLRHDLTNKTGEWVKLSPNAANYFEKVSTNSNWLAHPTQEEPLFLFIPEILEHIIHPNLYTCTVAVLCDSLWSNTSLCVRDGRVDITALKQTLSQWSSYELVSSGEHSYFRPIELELCEKQFAKRNSLEDFTKSFDNNFLSNVRAIAQLYWQSEPSLRFTSGEESPLIDYWIFSTPLYRNKGSIRYQLPGSFWRLIGALSEDIWMRLINGEKIQLDSSISNDALSFLSQDPPVKSKTPLPDKFRHATDIVSTYGPENLAISLAFSTKRVFHTWDQKSPEVQGYEDMSRIALFTPLPPGSVTKKDGKFLIVTTQPQFAKFIEDLRFRFATKSDLTVRIDLGGNAWIESVVQGPSDSVSNLISYSDLPETDRQYIWRQACDQTLAIVAAMEQLSKQRTQKTPAQNTPNPPQKP